MYQALQAPAGQAVLLAHQGHRGLVDRQGQARLDHQARLGHLDRVVQVVPQERQVLVAHRGLVDRLARQVLQARQVLLGQVAQVALAVQVDPVVRLDLQA